MFNLHLLTIIISKKNRKRIAKFELTKKFNETNFAKRQAIKAKRANLTDFDRFKVMVLKKKVTYSKYPTKTAQTCDYYDNISKQTHIPSK